MGFHHPVSLSLPLPLPHSPSTQRRRPSITPISISVRFDDRSDTSDFRHLLSHCAHIQPIAESSFLHRQQSLANALNALNASAYIAEPGASAAYFANISGSSWHLSERPLLLLVVPEARISVLTPAFEETRARLLPVPSLSAHGVFYPTWAEDADPYEIAVGALPLPRGDMDTDGSTIFVDGDVRHFIADGLAHAAPRTRVVSAPVEIRQIRERKSREELEILKCANEVTVLAIRAVRDKLHIGIRESEARRLLQRALASAGLRGGDGLVLFGENAALPHGSGTDRALGPSDLILIDSGGSLHGYESDVTRTFYLGESRPTRRHVKLWNLVREAQALAMDTAHAGTVTSAVDKAAREFLKRFGVAQYFTHRLGHGIGLEGHESPYLRGGSDDIIQTGHTFSNEPGVYIEGEVGVRIEDCFYIDEDGKPVYLTIGVGGPPIHPWLV
ncbi:peptidase M24 [Multifurca ochricompacta]|uniref:Peptidase M24 n=1 Tax=Multifurca ochricompacta TaxID=376703 RepID=A0AAD4MCX4_9AGAM|nr:peptidase M24 [Multifurca ochricompacta]